MQGNSVKVLISSIRSGGFESVILPFSTMEQLKNSLDSIKQQNFKIVKIYVTDPTLHFNLVKQDPTLKVVFT